MRLVLTRAFHRRRRMPIAAAVLAVAGTLAATESRAQPAAGTAPDADLVRASLVCDVAAVTPGRPFRLAVRLAMKDGWHVNWKNPGDAGLAPSIAWHLPPGFKTGTIQWPAPRRFRSGPIVIFGYANDVLLAVDVTPPASIRAGDSVHLAADVSWLACAESCIPGSASASLDLPVEAAPRTDAAARATIDAAEADSPTHAGVWNVSARLDGQGYILMDIQSAAGGRVTSDDVFFFPYQPGYVDNAAPQTVSVLEGLGGRAAYQLRVELSRMASALPTRVSGVLTSTGGWAEGDATPRAIEIDVPLSR